MSTESWLTQRLRRVRRASLLAYAALTAFGTYFCMYGFRKAFAAGSYVTPVDLGPLGRVDGKVALIVAQVCGYCLSKFVGVKVIAELEAKRRTIALVLAVALAEGALVAFAMAPTWLAPVCLFVNGLPLGLTWGLVFGFIEGRRGSDALGALVCTSFIVSSGFAKTVGKFLLDHGIQERWMPAYAGALFFAPTLMFVGLLAKLPPPDDEDLRARSRRVPMDASRRREFVSGIAPGLASLVVAYVVLTTYRDFRDSYAREIWDALGFGASSTILTTAEVPIAIGALVAVGFVSVIEDNRRALLVVHALMVAGSLLIGGATLMHRSGHLGSGAWMVTVGLGLYVGYVPFNCVLFDRLVAAKGSGGNAGFLIYVADAFGYLGSVALLLVKTFAAPRLEWLPFFERMSLATAACAALALLGASAYFRRTIPPAVA
jgi:hypothetical protein